MPGIDSITYELGAEEYSCVDIVKQYPERIPEGEDIDAYAEQWCRDRGLVKTYLETKRDITGVCRDLMERFFETAPIEPKDIELFIYGGHVEFGEPGTRPFRLAHDFGLPRTTEIFWHFIGCATGIAATRNALDRLHQSGKRHGLVLLQCVHPPEQPRVMSETVNGDGVMLLHVTTGPARYELVSHHVTALPEFWAFGLLPDGKIDPFEVIKNGVRHVREHLGDEDPNALAGIFPIYNGFAQWPRFAKALDVPLEMICLDTLADGAHIDSMDELRALADATPELEPGSKVLLYAQSLGMAYTSSLFTISNHH